jgi:hypothetical protein
MLTVYCCEGHVAALSLMEDSRMSPLAATRERLRALREANWRSYRYAVHHTLYALLITLVLLLPANFVAYTLSLALHIGSALRGLRFAAAHHLAGYWIAAGGTATPVTAGLWWLSAVWECLFWASCASAIALFILWIARLVTERVAARSAPVRMRQQGTARAA